MKPRLWIYKNGEPVQLRDSHAWLLFWIDFNPRLLGHEVADIQIELRFVPCDFDWGNPPRLFEVVLAGRTTNYDNAQRHATYAEALADYSHAVGLYTAGDELRRREIALDEIKESGRGSGSTVRDANAAPQPETSLEAGT